MLRVAHASRVLATVFHRREICWNLTHLHALAAYKKSSLRWNTATSSPRRALPGTVARRSEYLERRAGFGADVIHRDARMQLGEDEPAALLHLEDA
jgi:hypothetical protein